MPPPKISVIAREQSESKDPVDFRNADCRTLPQSQNKFCDSPLREGAKSGCAKIFFVYFLCRLHIIALDSK